MIDRRIKFTRSQSANKSPQGQIQPQDPIANAHMENNSIVDVGKTPSRNTSELPCGDTILAGYESTSSSERVLPGEGPASDCNLGRVNRNSDDSGDLSIAEDLSSVSISDLKPQHTSSAKDDLLNEELSVSPVLSATEHSPEENVSSDRNISSSLSDKVSTLPEMKLEGLTLDEPVVFAQDEEGTGEDGEAFLAKLHNNDEDLSQKEELVNEISPIPGSEAFDSERITYNPSSWTPMEIATATGDPERSTVEHTMELKSTYSEVEVL